MRIKNVRFVIVSAIVASLLLLLSCKEKSISEAVDYTQYVDPMIGTDGIVHTFPGATVPFGMVQLSPDNDTKGWNWCSGYHYSVNNIKGFSHTHLSGTGWADLGDILIMPTTGELKLKGGSKDNPDEGYRSRFSHDEEFASPGYYKVRLSDYDINVELTTTARTGFHRYTFPESKSSNIIIDPTSKIFSKVLQTSVEVVDNNTIEGYCHSNGWAGNRKCYFVARFSKPFKTFGVSKEDKPLEGVKSMVAEDAKVYVTYETKKDEVVDIKFSFSHVDIEGARKNLDAETHRKSFESVRKEAQNLWNKELSKIEIKKATKTQKRIFYTGLYHSIIAPNLSMDVDGRYYSMNKVSHAKDFTNYSTFSLWDTFRAVHPLLTLIDEERTVDFAKSLVSRYENGDQLPMWELMGYDNQCMIGYPSVSLIADAIMKDIKGFDYEKAFEAMKSIAFFGKNSDSDGESGLNEYIKYGYIPYEKAKKSVAKTMENSYYDWCIAKVAEKLGKTKDAEYFYKRSKNFETLYNKEKKLYWPKDAKGKWIPEMSLKSWDELQPHYVSGNIWAYSYFYPHAVNRAIKLMGGSEEFQKNLTKTVTDTLIMEGDQHVDISGFIGHYGHGDEPGHQIPYLFNYVGQPWKTQELVNKVIKTMYFDSPDGMPNNDDCGQMSAWYMFSSLGFYPACPGDNNYIIGSPQLENAVINLANGKTFEILTNNLSDKNIYIKSVILNGKNLERSYITHNEIMNGGKIEFNMQSVPNKTWAVKKSDCPVSDLK